MVARVLLDQRSCSRIPRPQGFVCRGRDNQVAFWRWVGHHARNCVLQVLIRRRIARV